MEDFDVAADWDPGVFSCYPDSRGLYRYASGLDFGYDKVLNHRFENPLHLRRGGTREGWLLAMGWQSVPEQYGRPGRPAPVVVTLLDQFGQPTVESVDLVVERSTKTNKSSVRPGPSPFSDASAPRTRVTDEDPCAPLSNSYEVVGPESRK